MYQPVLKRDTKVRPLSGTASGALRRPYISRSLSATERAGSDTPGPHYYSKEFIEVQNKSKKYKSMVKARRKKYSEFVLDVSARDKNAKPTTPKIDMDAIETRIKINIYGKDRYKLKTERIEPQQSIEESLRRNMMLTSRGSRVFKRRPKSAFPSTTPKKSMRTSSNTRPQTAPLRRRANKQSKSMKSSQSSTTVTHAIKFELDRASQNDSNDQMKIPQNKDIYSRYVVSVPHRKRSRQDHASFITGSPIRIRKGISPQRLALMRVREKLQGRRSITLGRLDSARRKNTAISPLRKKHARPKSAMPRRGCRDSKTTHRPQSAKPESTRRFRASIERDFEFVETTELENEYLIDGFDVEADKVLEPNDTNSNNDGAQKESSKLCDLEEESQGVGSVTAQSIHVMRRKTLLHLKQNLLPVPWSEESA